MSVVLQSDDPAFEELSDSARNLDMEEINNLPELKDSGLSIKEIKRGSLIIIFTVKNEQTLEKNLERIFNFLFKIEKINEVLSNHNLCRLEVSGYIYDPQEYYLDYGELYFNHEYCWKLKTIGKYFLLNFSVILIPL